MIGDLEDSVLLDVAVSSDDQAPVDLPAPVITGVDVIRYVLAGPYDPSTGFIPTRDDLTGLSPAPTAVVRSTGPFFTQVPILRLTREGLFVRPGLTDDSRVWVCGDTELVDFGFGLIVPYKGLPEDRIHLGQPPQQHRGDWHCRGDDVVLRGTYLFWDGPVLSSPPGMVYGDSRWDEVASYLGDEIFIDNYSLQRAPSLPTAYLEFKSARGAATSPWPLNWRAGPVIESISTSSDDHFTARNGETITITGKWFIDVESVSLRGEPQYFHDIDDTHIRVTLRVSGCAFSSPEEASLELATSDGRVTADLAILNSLPRCPKPKPPEPPPVPGVGPGIDLGDIWPAGAGGCTNGFCPP